MVSGAVLKIDGGIPNQLGKVAEAAGDLERDGYDGGWTAETSHDPFLPLLLAAEHTSRLQLGTNIAVAFARNPMIVANVGWDLQAYSKGRFILGLGTQIQPHIEKRFSMPWSHPAPRMREFIAALHAIWSAWREGTKLRFEGDFYTHKIMTPMFTPEPQPYPAPKIFLAAVGEAMTEMCGEVADGHLGHPMVSKRYLEEVTLPALLCGMERAGRARSGFEVSVEVMVATGESDAELETATAAVRKQIAFYGSTPAYRKVLELHGWGDLHDELNRLSKQGEWATMGSLIDDEMLGAFAVVGPAAEVGAALASRCEGGVHGGVDRVLPLFYGASKSCIDTALKAFQRG
jgi:probable F420-dependent oxidoreductase